jgi:hypothetical protein
MAGQAAAAQAMLQRHKGQHLLQDACWQLQQLLILGLLLQHETRQEKRQSG